MVSRDLSRAAERERLDRQNTHFIPFLFSILYCNLLRAAILSLKVVGCDGHGMSGDEATGKR